MGLETERKFLVNKSLWNKVKGNGKLYKQGYLLLSSTKTIRVRMVEDEAGFITIKGKGKGLSRPEYEYSIPLKEAEELLSNFCDVIVSKKRFQVNTNNKIWEVDEFLNDNEGLIIAEVELEHEEENITLPNWVAEEVSNDNRYYNSELSINPYKNWKDEKK